jgi:cytochrome c oxidase assembly protein subunit 11
VPFDPRASAHARLAALPSLARRHRGVALAATAVVAVMVVASFAAVPLYGYLCQVTNFDGTPRRASVASPVVLERTLNVRFDANVGPGFPWTFAPVETTRTVKIGDTNLVFFRARNTADHPLRGSATYNVFPEQTAAYFNKLECFCFREQELGPGEEMEFPVSFFIDPQIVNDRDARAVTHITLSYTFYPVTPAPPAGVTARPARRANTGANGTRQGPPAIGSGSS